MSLLASYNIYPALNFGKGITATSSKCIDNILTNRNLQTIRTEAIQIDFSDHDAQLIELMDLSVVKTNTINIINYSRLFNNKNIINYLEYINKVSWDCLYGNTENNN